ncbi:hypothetical protein ACR0ST_08085 [Aliidiomarina sp. Khilg15.8]
MKQLIQLAILNVLVLAVPVATAASLHTAFEKYDDGQHELAYEQFNDLLALANPVAALQMSLMTLDEEGTEYDPAKAYSLAAVAADWGYSDAASIAAQIKPHLSAAEVEQVAIYEEDIKSHQQIFNFEEQVVRITPMRKSKVKVLDRPEVRFPRVIAAHYRIGWHRMLLLVAKDGSVAVQDDASRAITRDFRGPAYKETKGWRYHPMEKPDLTMVLMDYSFEGRSNVASYLKFVKRAWEPAQAESPENQFLLGQMLLQLEAGLDEKTVNFDNSLKASGPPEETDFDIESETVTWPLVWSGIHWLNKAARNGNRDAQWSLAVSQEEWMRYLVSQGDVQAKTWHGAKLASRAINEEDRDYGLQLLREARDSGDETAIAVASHYL